MRYDRKTLHIVGQILYGPGWVEALSNGLGLNMRTVQRWASGKNPIHPLVWPKIAALCRPRIAEIEKLAAKFEKDGIGRPKHLETCALTLWPDDTRSRCDCGAK
jgi:hypothetical protein